MTEAAMRFGWAMGWVAVGGCYPWVGAREHAEANPDECLWYEDADGDHFGDPATERVTCQPPAGGAWVDLGGDCDDDDPAVNPETTWFRDADGDGLGFVADVAVDRLTVCRPGAAWSRVQGDCNDRDAAVGGPTSWYEDGDADGYGVDGATRDLCGAEVGWSSRGGDCNDAARTVNPEAVEVCDGQDNNCDGLEDEEDASIVVTWYRDHDGDGFGDGDRARVASCVPPEPAGWVTGATDCDDLQRARNPDAAEICNGTDDDCDGAEDDADPGVTDRRTWFADDDGDGFGVPVTQCFEPVNPTTVGGDCAPSDPLRHPDAPEVCNAVDDDCDAAVDDADADVTGRIGWYQDPDLDGWGDPTTMTVGCYAPSADWTSVGGDCDESSPAVHPGVPEVWYDGTDQDCDGADDYDGDRDGSRSDAHGGADCDDTDAAVFDGALERCDGRMNDCGTPWIATDEDGLATWYGLDGTVAEIAGPLQSGLYTFDLPGEVVFCDGTFHVELVAAAPVVLRSLHRSGATRLTGDGVARVLHAAAETVLDGLTLADGFVATDDGGCVFAQGPLTVTESTFEGCRASDGGAVSGTSSITIASSILRNNTAEVRGGGVFLEGFARLTCAGCSFEGNEAGSVGGGVDAHGSATVVITGTSFVANTASGGQGGAIGVESSAAVSVDGTAFVDNSGWDSGALWVEGGSITVTDSDFLGNVATTFHGGAIRVDEGSASFERCLFVGNSAAQAGGVARVFDGATTSFDNCAFLGNTATSGGVAEVNIPGYRSTRSPTTFLSMSSCDFGVDGSPSENLPTDLSVAYSVGGDWTQLDSDLEGLVSVACEDIVCQ